MLSIEECSEFLRTREFFTKEVNFLATASNSARHCKMITRLHSNGRNLICISKVLERITFDGSIGEPPHHEFGDKLADYSEYVQSLGVTAEQLVELSIKVDAGLIDCFSARAAELLGVISGGSYEDYESRERIKQ